MSTPDTRQLPTASATQLEARKKHNQLAAYNPFVQMANRFQFKLNFGRKTIDMYW